MTHLTLPSEVEPESIADLVADCGAIRTAITRRPHRTPPPVRTHPEHPEVAIPDSTAALLDGMAEYGD